MKLRTRTRTSTDAGATSGAVSCELCRRDVVVGHDGRCILGHKVRGWSAPAAPTVPTEMSEPVDAVPAAAVEATTQRLEARVGASVTPVDYLDQLGDMGSFGQPPAVAAEPSPQAEAHPHPYDDVLNWDVEGPPGQDAAADTLAADHQTPDPLGWLEQVAAGVRHEETQELQGAREVAEPVAATHVGTADVDAPDVEAGHVEAGHVEAGAAEGDQVGDGDAVDAAWAAMLAQEGTDAAEDARMALRKRLAMFAGGGLFGALTVAATALATLS